MQDTDCTSLNSERLMTIKTASGNMDATDPQGTHMTTRSRKVQPGLKQKAEQLLVMAAVSKEFSFPPTEASRPRKRKLQDVVAAERPSISDRREAEESIPKRLLSSQESSKKSPKPKSPKELDEKRMKRYRKQAPQSYLQKLLRAQTQR